MTTAATLPDAAVAGTATAWQAAREAVAAAVGSEPGYLARLRERGFDRFRALGFPTTKQEAWRFTNVAPIARTTWATAPASNLARVSADDVARLAFPGTRLLVLVDGRYAPELSSPGLLDGGLVLGSLAAAIADPATAAGVEGALGRHAAFEQQAFVALNTALFVDGVYVRVPKGRVVAEPIQILHVATAPTSDGSEPYAVFPRILVVAEEHAEVSLLESYVSLAGGTYFTCPVTEVVTQPTAVVRHTKLQREATSAYHVATSQARHERGSAFRSVSISLGGSLVRNDVNACLAGEGVDCILDGLYLVTGTQLVDYHMRVEHAAPNTSSRELFKGILEEKGRSVFNGLIHVHKGAQKTDAKQSNRNLILSREATANSNPQLEIFADDVKCTHGSTTGHLDDEAVFYLRSRGIGEAAAKSLLTYAFAHEVLELVAIESVRRELEEFLFARLPGGEVVRQAV